MIVDLIFDKKFQHFEVKTLTGVKSFQVIDSYFKIVFLDDDRANVYVKTSDYRLEGIYDEV